MVVFSLDSIFKKNYKALLKKLARVSTRAFLLREQIKICNLYVKVTANEIIQDISEVWMNRIQ